MTKLEFLLLLDEQLGLKPGTLKGETVLSEVDAWDSLMVVNFLALVDENFSVAVQPKKIAACKTFGELAALLPDHVR